MRDYPLYPNSPVIDSPVGVEEITAITEAAKQAFFAQVASDLNDLYPGSKTWGDLAPEEVASIDQIARGWVNSFALNNSAVQEYENEVIEATLDTTDPSALNYDLPEGILSVKVNYPYGSAPFYDVDIRGPRGIVFDYIASNFGQDVADEWEEGV